MDSGAAHGGAPNYSGMPGMMGGGHHGQAADPHQHMMELLGLLRAVSCRIHNFKPQRLQCPPSKNLLQLRPWLGQKHGEIAERSG